MNSAGPLSDKVESIQSRTAFDFVRYANCWEDADVLVAALRPSNGTRMLSIASAGDNTLALLAEGAEVVAADISPVQLACLELRCVAFAELEYETLLEFLGVRATHDRLRTYKGLASQLSSASRDFWDAHPENISQGIIHAGRFEGYFRLFRKRVLPLIHSRRTVTELLQPKDLAARKAFWTKRWNNRRWRMLFRVFFGRFLMGRLGRDPEFFRYVEGSIADRLLQRTHFGLTQIPTDQNPFLHYIATGNFGSALPRYLRRENFTRIREGLNRLTVHHGPVEQAARLHAVGGYDGLNLSDVFEYVNEESSSSVYAELVECCRPGARIAYWNTLVPRSCPQQLTTRVQPLNALSQELHARDKAFFYCHFQVDELPG